MIYKISPDPFAKEGKKWLTRLREEPRKVCLALLTIHFRRGDRFDEAVGIIFENLFVF